MRLLFDQCTRVPLPNSLRRHAVEMAYERTWELLTKGQLLDAAEVANQL